MPGNIQVSVLGLMDVLSPPPLSSLSLKVVMGKKEYQNVGGGELVFPVVTLRDNLIVMVHNLEGQEMLRTEFRTMLLVEQGFWDDLFPLKDGGSIHLKLQFSLSEEDRQRIREKRDSAIRRKCVEKPRARHRRSFSDNRIGGSSTITTIEISAKGTAFEHSELNDPIKMEMHQAPLQSTLHVSRQSSDQGALCLTKTKDDKQLSSEVVLHSQSSCFENITEPSIYSGAESEKYKYFSPKSKDMPDRGLNSNVRKMITAFEGSAYQGVGTHFGQRAKFLASKIGMISSPKSAVAEGRDLNIPQTMLKSFSAGMLSEISLQGNSKLEESFSPKKNKEKHHFVQETCYETLGNKKQVLDLNNEEKIHKLDTCVVEIGATKNSSLLAEPPYYASSNSSVAVHNVSKISGTGKSTKLGITLGASRERNDFASVEVEKGSPTIKLQKSCESIAEKVNLDLMQKADESSASHAASRTFKERPSPHSSEEMVGAGAENITDSGKNHSKSRIGDGNATSTQSSNNTTAETVHFMEKNEVHNFLDRPLSSKKMQDESINTEDPCSTSLHRQGSSIVVSRTVGDENASQIPPNEQVSESAFLEAGVLTYGYNSLCPIGTLGIWTPRHLCISTGNKLLRDFLESCTVLEETTQIESHFMREANTKQKKDGDACIQGNDTEALPSSKNSYIKNLSCSFKSNGGLIEKAVQIVVVIVACGLLLNNR